MLWWNCGLSMGSSFQCISVLSWNVLGLGKLDKRRVVKDALATAKDSVFCLQETKLKMCLVEQWLLKKLL
jgi:exonuclease III